MPESSTAQIISAFAAIASFIVASLGFFMVVRQLRMNQQFTALKSVTDLNAHLRANEVVLAERFPSYIEFGKKMTSADAARMTENKELQARVRSYLATCDTIARGVLFKRHEGRNSFPLGLGSGPLDFDLVKEMIGRHLVDIYDLWEPFIEHRRTLRGDNSLYGGFEQLVKRLERSGISRGSVFYDDASQKT